MAGRIEIENAPCDGGAVYQKKHGSRLLAGLGRAKALTKHVKRNIAFLCPIVLTPDLGTFRGSYRCRQAGQKTRAYT